MYLGDLQKKDLTFVLNNLERQELLVEFTSQYATSWEKDTHMTNISKTICDEQKRQRPAMQLDLLEQGQLEDCVGIFILIQYNWVWEIRSQGNFSFTGNAVRASLLVECMSLCL